MRAKRAGRGSAGVTRTNGHHGRKQTRLAIELARADYRVVRIDAVRVARDLAEIAAALARPSRSTRQDRVNDLLACARGCRIFIVFPQGSGPLGLLEMSSEDGLILIWQRHLAIDDDLVECVERK